MDKKEDFQQIIEKYDFGKFTAESAELFDIAQKYLFRKERIKEWYLKPLYQAAYALALFLGNQIKIRLKKLQNIKNGYPKTGILRSKRVNFFYHQ